MRTNTMKAKILSGEPVAGVIISSADEQLVEVLGYGGFDYVMIDCEHGHMSVRECETLVRASEAVGITPVGAGAAQRARCHPPAPRYRGSGHCHPAGEQRRRRASSRRRGLLSPAR